jgi:hypothetical protein
VSLLPDGAQVSWGFTTPDVVVRPLRAADVDLDFAAVMASGDELRSRTGGRWPTLDFTRAENLRDLVNHQEEHEHGVAFTYTVMNPSQTRCLGCIYVNPLRAMLAEHGLTDADTLAGEHDVWVRFWVRSDEIAGDLEERLFLDLLRWFRQEWAFGRVVFTTQPSVPRQRALYEGAGLRLTHDLPNMLVFESHG